MAANTNKVLDAINGVMADIGVGGIAKDRNNAQQGYKFRGIDDVYNALSPILAKHRLVIVPDVMEREVVERQTRNGGALFYVTVKVKWTLASAEDASSIEAVTYGEAMDSADKATNKAMSAAYKYMAMMAFCIPTEGDNDADMTTHDVAPDPHRRDRSKEGLAVTAATSAIIMCETLDELKAWGKANAEMINSLPKAHSAEITKAYKQRADGLKEPLRTPPPPPPPAKTTSGGGGTDPFDDEIPF